MKEHGTHECTPMKHTSGMIFRNKWREIHYLLLKFIITNSAWKKLKSTHGYLCQNMQIMVSNIALNSVLLEVVVSEIVKHGRCDQMHQTTILDQWLEEM